MILIKIFYLWFYDSSLYCMFRVVSKKYFWQPCGLAWHSSGAFDPHTVAKDGSGPHTL
jgi:hypothetical protein